MPSARTKLNDEDPVTRMSSGFMQQLAAAGIPAHAELEADGVPFFALAKGSCCSSQ